MIAHIYVIYILVHRPLLKHLCVVALQQLKCWRAMQKLFLVGGDYYIIYLCTTKAAIDSGKLENNCSQYK